MPRVTRRDLLKTGLAASAVAAGARLIPAAQANVETEFQQRVAASPAVAAASRRERLLMNTNWKFQLGNADDPAKDFNFGAMRRGDLSFAKATGVAAPASARFNDSAWRSVELPHDWAIELPFKNDPGLPDHGGKPLGRMYPETSIGWYRRTFTLPETDVGRRITVAFDGVFRDAMVFFNGQFIGQNFSGYSGFRFDLTDFALYGGTNVLAVRVDATLGEGWFYEGAGIYRHVWLEKTDPLHFAADGLIVRAQTRTEQDISTATLALSAEVVNETADARMCRVRWLIFDAGGKEVASAVAAPVSVAADSTHTIEATAVLSQPALWSLESPVLYSAQASLELLAGTSPRAGATETDRMQTGFGVRNARFDPERGFFLNGRSVKIQGTCNHHDHAGVGAALPDRLHTFRVQTLKNMGSNGCRTSHNPPADAFLDACDRLGMVVMAETRMMSSTPEDRASSSAWYAAAEITPA